MSQLQIHGLIVAPLIDLSVYIWQECGSIALLRYPINCAPTAMPSPHVYVSFVTTSIIPGFYASLLLIMFSKCILFYSN